MSLRATTEKILEAVSSIKMTSKSAYVEQALWEKFSRDFLTHPKFRCAEALDQLFSRLPQA